MSNTKFFTNRDNNTLMKEFEGILRHNESIKNLDVIVGFLRASGYYTLRPFLNGIDKVRILIGIDVDKYIARAAKTGKIKVISPLNTADDVDEEKPLHRVYGPNQKQYERKAPTTRLRVIRSDGSIIEEASAAQTMVAAIKEAGYENVHNLGLKNNNVPLVDYTKDSVYGKSQVEIERGVFVITHSATKRKQEHLQNISDSLRLGWKVEIVTK